MGGYFFDEPQTKADFVYWSKIPKWTLDQIVALSLGKDPRFVSSDKFTHGTRGNDFSATYFGRLDILHEHLAAGELEEKTSSTRVIECAAEYDFPLPQELIDLVRRLAERRSGKLLISRKTSAASAQSTLIEDAVWREVQSHPNSKPHSGDEPIFMVADDIPSPEPNEPENRSASNDEKAVPKAHKKTSAPARSAHPDLMSIREQKNMQIMLATLAIRLCQFDRNAPKNGAIQKIIKHLKAAGVPLSKGTVLKNLRASVAAMEERLDKSKELEKARRR